MKSLALAVAVGCANALPQRHGFGQGFGGFAGFTGGFPWGHGRPGPSDIASSFPTPPWISEASGIPFVPQTTSQSEDDQPSSVSTFFESPATSPTAQSFDSSPTSVFNAAPTPYVTQSPSAVAPIMPTTNNDVMSTVTASWEAQPTVKPDPNAPNTHQNYGAGKVSFAGVNIAGYDFGCTTDGACDISKVNDIANGNGIAQMQHFIRDDGLNTFRLPVGWQFLTNNVLGGNLDPNNFPKYDKLVQGCISSGAKMCIIDIHNYARWYSGIIGQSGVTNEPYIALITSLAQRYRNNPQVAFGIMNEPHDLDINTWANTAQLAVNAIRNNGCGSHVILIPGTNYASAGAFQYNSGAALLNIKNPDGSTRGLIFDVHQYNDADYTGTHTNCVTNNIANAFQPLATWLRQHGRQAMLTENGGGAYDPSCLQYICQQMDFINQNSDVFRGVTTWAAGGWWSNYELIETPTLANNVWTDVPLVQQCVVAKFRGANGVL